MSPHRSITIVLVGLVVLSTVPSGVIAQEPSPPANPVPLTEYERSDRVVLDGQTYRVYTYNSPLPFVDGVAVYSDGRAIENRNLVEKVVAVHARQTTVAGLRSDEMAILRRLKRQSHTLEKRIPAVVAEINATIAYTEKLEETTIGNRSARTVAIERIPAFEDEFRVEYGKSRIERTRKTLLKLETAATNLNENATAVINLIEKRRNGADIDKTELFRHYVATISALERTETVASDLKYPLSVTAEHLTTIAKQSDKLPRVETEMKRRFTTFAEEIETSKKTIIETRKRLTADRKTLQKVDRRAEAMRERLMKQWEPKGSIKAKVYGLIGEIGLLMFAGLWTGLTLRKT